MNSYGRQAMEHWRRWLPARYRSITDPEAFFSMLGQQAESQILDLAEQLEGPDLPGEGYPEKVGRLNMARKQAQEWVLREVILLDPEPQTARRTRRTRTRRTCSGGCRTRRRGRHRTGGTWRTTRTCRNSHRGPGHSGPGAGEQSAPSGAKARISANLTAIRTVRAITEQGRVATPDEQAAMARWSSWGAVPSIFDESREEHAAERAELRSLLTER